MAGQDRPLTTATLTSSTLNSRTEVEQPPPEVLELYELQVTSGGDITSNGDRNNCIYAPGTSAASLSSGETRVVPVRTVSGLRGATANRNNLTGSRDKRQPRIWTQVRQFWSKQVALAVPQKSNRDHFGMLQLFSTLPCAWVHD